MFEIQDLEYDLMRYCLKRKGKWWANHCFRNKEVNNLYRKLRKKSLSDIYEILEE